MNSKEPNPARPPKPEPPPPPPPKKNVGFEIEDVMMRNQELRIQLRNLQKEIEDNHSEWCTCVDNGDLIYNSCTVCDLIATWNPKFIEDFRAGFE